jgi:hypothetical protein
MTDIQQLLDREAIRDCLFRYCRGIDRADEVALRSAYWPDGTDHHGSYVGDAKGFCDWAMTVLPKVERSIHQLHNILIEFKDGRAVAETYFSAIQRQPGPAGMQQWDLKGRYLDVFEKRGDEWRIRDRMVVFDWVEETPVPALPEAERFGPRQPIGAQFPDDPVYTFLV